MTTAPHTPIAKTGAIAMYGESQTRGRLSELPGIDAATNQAVAALLFDEHSAHLRPYLLLFFQQNNERTRQLAFGGVQPNLSLGVVRDPPVALPPEAEQREIVRRVGELAQLIDSLTRRHAAASQRLELLRDTVRAEAR